MIRLLLLLHRYLGIAVGVLMVMWCVTGLVMMYVSYPSLDQRVRLAHLAPLDWHECCRIAAGALADGDPVGAIRIEMLAGRPVLDLGAGPDATGLIDLTSGAPIAHISPAQAASVAARYAVRGAARAPRLLGRIDYDQWTVALNSAADGPLYHFALGDRAHTQLYVASRTGRVVQLTTGRQRLWNWLGAVPHWLYFARLRRRPVAWTWVIIVTAGIGSFLAATGLYIGVRQWLNRPARRWSPYRGFSLWHHLAGLVFGLVTLSWVVSGFLSVNPFGLLEGPGPSAALERLRGAAPDGRQLRAALQALAASPPAGAVSIRGTRLDGRLYLIAATATGRRRRLAADGAPAPLGAAALADIGRALTGTASAPQWLRQGDRYYFGHHSQPVRLPVYRWIGRGAQHTRFYVDPVTGALLAAFGPGARAYRWWFDAPHRLDFAVALRGRPQWDVLMWLLLMGATLSAATGAYLGYRRLVR